VPLQEIVSFYPPKNWALNVIPYEDFKICSTLALEALIA
jgi:hypothetical protein